MQDQSLCGLAGEKLYIIMQNSFASSKIQNSVKLMFFKVYVYVYVRKQVGNILCGPMILCLILILSSMLQILGAVCNGEIIYNWQHRAEG